MDLKVKVDYIVYQHKTLEFVEKGSSGRLKKYLDEYFKDADTVTVQDLRLAADSFIRDECNFILAEELAYLDDIGDVTFINEDEFYKEFSYLLRTNSTTCCTYVPYNANYCPTCGKKLK